VRRPGRKQRRADRSVSAYLRLDDYLPRPPPFRLVVAFEELEALVGEPLPDDARADAAWWFRRPASARWQVESVYLHTGLVTFRQLS
jgi:hypothetical protein